MKKVLIVDDNPVLTSIYQNKLEGEGFQVSVAYDGEAALDAITRQHPDLVVLDQMLPKMTGIEVLKKIRSQAELHRLPVVMFANPMVGDMVREVWAAGADQVLTKGVDTHLQIVELVKKTLTASTLLAQALKPSTARS